MNKIDLILNSLDEMFPNATVELTHKNTFELLIAVILSAQTTDVAVNKVTANLFLKYQNPKELSLALISDVENILKSIGLYKTKAKNIIKTAAIIDEKFNGEVPNNRKDLEKLPGVGRKTANVIRGNIYKIPSIVVDTHVKRISNRLGFTKSEDPTKIEYDLMDILPKEYWIRYNLQVIAHGRNICRARSPKCNQCFLNQLCPHYSKKTLETRDEIE